MNLAALRTELLARGFEYLVAPDGNLGATDNTRVDRYLNVAISEICELEDWPFLLASVTGTAPLDVADLRTVQTVIDTASRRKLRPSNAGQLTDAYADLSTGGSPCAYFFTSQTTIDVFPANSTESLTVTYWKAPTDLSADDDEPVIPARYQYAIVDYAAARAFADASDFQEAQGARAEGDRLVNLMQANLIDPQHDSPELIRTSWGTDC